jgi:hypothetical protein
MAPSTKTDTNTNTKAKIAKAVGKASSTKAGPKKDLLTPLKLKPKASKNTNTSPVNKSNQHSVIKMLTLGTQHSLATAIGFTIHRMSRQIAAFHCSLQCH